MVATPHLNKSVGIGILVGGAVLAQIVGQAITWLNQLLVAILIGILLANTIRLPQSVHAGIETHKLWLSAGIVLMGSSLTITDIVASGPIVLVLVTLTVVITILLVEGLARYVFGIHGSLSSLLAAGAGICGVSAVVAVAGSIEAKEEQIAYAAGTILLFDAVTIIVYPTIGSQLILPDRVFGVWSGLSMFSTGPVVAAGFTYSDVAGQWATITKLTRNVFIGGLVLVYAGYYTRTDIDENTSARTLWNEFPKFVIGFVALAILSSAGLFSATTQTQLKHAYNWLFMIAFVGLGAELHKDVFMDAGLRPVLAILTGLVIMGATSLGITWWVLG